MDETLKQLTALLADKDFLLLDKEFSDFNPFDVLDVSHFEIRHSNILAWLFAPDQSHSFGDLFFKQFLYSLAASQSYPSNDDKRKKKIESLILKAESRKITKIKVYREYKTDAKRRVDLLLKCGFDSSQKDDAIILIENKFFAKQGLRQLDDYFNYAQKAFGDKKGLDDRIIPVYLSLDEDNEPKGNRKEEYYHLAYRDVYGIIENIIAAEEASANNSEALAFVKHYKKILEDYINMGGQKEDLAKSIYIKHKAAIDFIIKNSAAPIAEAGSRFLGGFKNDGLLPLKAGNSKFFPFYDERLKEIVGGAEKDWRQGSICGYYFLLKENSGKDLSENLSFHIEVGPFENLEERKKFIGVLNKHGFKTGKSDVCSGIYSESLKIENPLNEDEIFYAMKVLFEKKKTKDTIAKLKECINDYLE